MNRWVMLVALGGLVGCPEAEVADIDDDTEALQIPDIRGDYDATFTDTEGCDAVTVEAAWATGPLTIAGDLGSPSFAFGEVALAGTVASSFSFTFGGDVTVNAQDLAVTAEGVAFEDDGRWTLEGDLEVSPVDGDGAPSCTLAGAFTALQGIE